MIINPENTFYDKKKSDPSKNPDNKDFNEWGLDEDGLDEWGLDKEGLEDDCSLLITIQDMLGDRDYRERVGSVEIYSGFLDEMGYVFAEIEMKSKRRFSHNVTRKKIVDLTQDFWREILNYPCFSEEEKKLASREDQEFDRFEDLVQKQLVLQALFPVFQKKVPTITSLDFLLRTFFNLVEECRDFSNTAKDPELIEKILQIYEETIDSWPTIRDLFKNGLAMEFFLDFD